MQEIKVIVLDFDGVLNNGPFRQTLTKHPREELRKPGADHAKIMRENVDPVNMKRFKDLTDQVPGVKIVISSSWGNYFDLKKFKSFFKKFDIKADVLCVTPRKMSSTKVEEISFFFSDFEEDYPKMKISQYVILDDDVLYGKHSNGRGYSEEKYDFSSHFILTKDETGLTDEDVKTVVDLLTKPSSLSTRVELFGVIQKKQAIIKDLKWDLDMLLRDLKKPDCSLESVKERVQELVKELEKKS